MSAKNFVVMDWGSTNVRAFLYIDDKLVETEVSGRRYCSQRRCL